MTKTSKLGHDLSSAMVMFIYLAPSIVSCISGILIRQLATAIFTLFYFRLFVQ